MSLFIVYFIVSLGNIRAIITAQKNIRFEQKDLHIELSKNGKNILILFMDRAISGFLPLILEENPKLVKELSGFVYYPRTISFATQTLYSEPSLLGGYEYTPKGLQNDKTRQMVDKHNEAISVLPELFRKNNYQVSLVDIPYPNYNDPKRPSVYHPDIFISKNKNYTPMRNEKLIQGIKYNVFSFNLMRLSPRISRNFIYNDADYFNDSIWRFYQNISSQDALAAFNVYIDQLKVIDQKQGTLMILHSKLPHEPTLLNKNYEHFTTTEEINSDCPDIHRNHSISNLSDRMHYDVNMLSYIEITKLFHKMKGMGVYNNTRIIVVSDHGWHVEGIPDVPPDITQNNAVLLVKDFNTIGKLKFDSSFMTTADVPFLACQDIIQNPINPFTHKTLTTSEKDIGIDIIDSYFSKWSPTQYKDKKRTYLYEDEGEDEVTYRHIDKNTIKDMIKMEKEKQ